MILGPAKGLFYAYLYISVDTLKKERVPLLKRVLSICFNVRGTYHPPFKKFSLAGQWKKPNQKLAAWMKIQQVRPAIENTNFETPRWKFDR